MLNFLDKILAGPNNPAAVPMAFPASIVFGMALVAKYIL